MATLIVPGFLMATTAAGIKKSGKPDLAVVISEVPCRAVGVFTQNRFAAPVIEVCKLYIQSEMTWGCVVNSGNANACTGKQGFKDAETVSALVAKKQDVPAESILPASTGIIGHPLPMAKLRKGIAQCMRSLVPLELTGFSTAIMTTDLVPKTSFRKLSVDGKTVTLGGASKGSGMIAPNMGTMLGFLFTDVSMPKRMLQKLLREVCGQSFNCVTVDGDSSTNDMVLLLSNGVSGVHISDPKSVAYRQFKAALLEIAVDLSVQIAKDGEGATRCITVTVSGAKTEKHAHAIARSVAESCLVKTAVHGADPNWGRIVCAIGYSGIPIVPDSVMVSIQGDCVFKNGQPAKFSPAKLSKKMKGDTTIDICLGMGKATSRIWTCDLTKEYITINADYHT